MQIDTKINPRWCEALLGMLEGDLNHNRVAEVKRMLRIGIDSIRKGLRAGGEYTAYIIEAKNLSDNSCPVYLRRRYNPAIWTPDVNMAFQFCRRIDAERYMEDDGTCQVVARVVLPDGAYFGPVAEKEKKKEML